MNLDRNINSDGKGKYALINLRKLEGNPRTAEELAAAILKNPEAMEFGEVGSPNEFFVIKLKDQYAQSALYDYGHNAWADGDKAYARQIYELAARSGPNHPLCKKPD